MFVKCDNENSENITTAIISHSTVLDIIIVIIWVRTIQDYKCDGVIIH